MTEVIELLSSSSPPSTTPKPGQQTVLSAQESVLYETFDFRSDDFDETGSIDFRLDRPLKRPRLSPDRNVRRMSLGRGGRGSQVKPPCVEPTINISSDDVSWPHPKPDKAVQLPKSFAPQEPNGNIYDEITFSSSAPELRRTEAGKSGSPWRLSLDDSDDDLLDDVFQSLSQPTRHALNDDDAEDLYSQRTASLLANLTNQLGKERKPNSRPPKSKVSDTASKQTALANAPDDIQFSSSPVKAPASRPSKSSDDQKASKAAEKAALKAEKEAAKEAERERKRLDRERKAREKQQAADLAEVNKSKTGKKVASPEMLLDMSSFLRGTSVGNQVEQYMHTAHVEVNYFDEEVNLTENAPEQDVYGNVVMWRRKVKATYNDEEGLWEPTSSSRIVKEKHVLIHLPAVEFAAMIRGSKATSPPSQVPTEPEMKSNLDAHVASIRQRFHDCIPFYLIEGLEGWIKKNANAKNRAYTAAVRARLIESDARGSATLQSGSARAKSRKRKKPATDNLDLSFITSDVVEELLLHLQLAHQPILIHHTVSPATTASQIFALTQHLSTRPYRLAQLDYNLKSASFCMDTGQVRTGDDAKDTVVKMLQEVQRVTPSMAYGIVDQWSSVRKLVTGFERHGNLMLENVRKSANRDGAWSDRKLGPMVSRRLYKVFMGRDPSATDGMS
ncbi:hypothetical protein A1O1_02795 [Capronia coronata CBS 617.96]|uniref:ERCC4 domain-containing protein n=1 Tax=Capronia coronata CBS 617.96 TaxID=1182541 RepID=W9YYQ7_9EURO|nr:uncharacterized protein A1O1_02795 [Capronia coronata CBS 617.96]EXJ94401.1 hypothetical protein A1O1_02795 [Capronia coronata CBS 617.96]